MRFAWGTFLCPTIYILCIREIPWPWPNKNTYRFTFSELIFFKKYILIHMWMWMWRRKSGGIVFFCKQLHQWINLYFPNSKMYLSRFRNTFVQMLKYFCPNCIIWRRKTFSWRRLRRWINLWQPLALHPHSSPYGWLIGQGMRISDKKMTIRGTMVRSEVCNAWCFCLG